MRLKQMPIVKDLVLVGGGHSHVAVLKSLGMHPMPGVRITLIARDVLTPYSGMLPGFIAGHYNLEECHIDLSPLAGFAGARLYRDEVVGIDLAGKQVHCARRPPVPYDVLSLNIGSRPKQNDVPGSAVHATPVKPIDGFSARWEGIVRRVLDENRASSIGVVGGGAGGVELILSMQYRLRGMLQARGHDPNRLQFLLVTAGGLLPSHNPRVGKMFSRILTDRKIRLYSQHDVVAVEPGRARCADGTEIQIDEIIWVTQAGAAPWLAKSGLDMDPNGFVRVRPSLQSLSDLNVFAAGDVAAVDGHPRPKAGVFAVRQGPPLARNLRRVLSGRAPKPFFPQDKFLSLISTGDKFAVASRGAWALEGRWLWTVKDWIDRRFMRKYTDLPEMPVADPPSPPIGIAGAPLEALTNLGMRCGGCGAKIGSAVLSRVMARLKVVTRDEIVVGLESPDDAAIVKPPPPGTLLVQTADYFRAFVDDPYVFGRIAANHSLGDIYAMGGEPTTALAIATVPYGVESKVEDDLFQMMSGAITVLNEAGCALVGGHSGEGAELAVGFAVTGTISDKRILRKNGLLPGQALILTKPLGTGILFASVMRNRARGGWIDAALTSMQVTSRDAAACLKRFGATACTDVTGFGLIGHLAEMTRPSGVHAQINLSALPLLDGARACVEDGIVSSLQPQNMRLRDVIQDAQMYESDPRYVLSFDPQTAGGLLAGVPADRAADCVSELKAMGYSSAAIIGSVLPATTEFHQIRIVE